jgi:hypothetical protein
LEERKERHPDRCEERHLREDEESTSDQGAPRVAKISASEQPLHDELVGSVTRHCEEASPDEAGPERVGAGEVEAKVEEANRIARLRPEFEGAPQPTRQRRDEKA